MNKSNKKPPQLLMVLLIGIVVSLVNYFAYPFLIEKVNEEVEIPIVKKTISQYQLIDQDCISYQKVSASVINETMIVDENAILGKYVSAGFTLSEGMFFYKQALSSENEIMSDSGVGLDKENYLYSLPLDEVTSTNNCLLQGQFVDLYFISKTSLLSQYKTIIGLLAYHIQVSQIIYDDNNQASYGIFIVDQRQLDYLLRASQIGTIRPIISGKSIILDVNSDQYYDMERLYCLIDQYTLSLKEGNGQNVSFE